MEEKQTKTAHVSVLLQEVIDVLAIQPTDIVVDGTVGGGGHAEAILSLLGDEGAYLAIDADSDALLRVQARLGEDVRVHYQQGNFRCIKQYVKDQNLGTVTKVLLDLGLSSDQLDTATGRGFSFQRDEPLTMTFDKKPGPGKITAWHIVNEWTEESIADVVYAYGEDRKARKIANAIVTAREEAPIETTTALADIIATTLGTRSHIHPATRTFQALRIAVNDELGALTQVLEDSLSILAKDGRIAIISFHSLEDRIVKRTFRDWAKEGKGKVLTKKPIVPTEEESSRNRRSRSSKLRCFQKA